MFNKFFTIALALLCIVSIVTMASAETYTVNAIVVSIDYDSNMVTVETMDGNDWTFYDGNDWTLFDVCAVTFDDVETPLIYDDVITSVNYIIGISECVF